MPALAKVIAIPPPIVPAPITAAVPIGRVGVSRGTSGIFVASRSAKKAWIWALAWGEARHSRKSSRSRRSPSAKGSVTAARTASMHLNGAR